MRRTLRAALAATSVAVAMVALSGCTGGSQVLPPVIVDIADVDGTTVEVQEGGAIDITGDDETYTDWTADIADPSIVSFTPGRDDGSAQFNPGLEAKSVGSTDVTLENSSSGDSVSFTVDVVEKQH